MGPEVLIVLWGKRLLLRVSGVLKVNSLSALCYAMLGTAEDGVLLPDSHSPGFVLTSLMSFRGLVTVRRGCMRHLGMSNLTLQTFELLSADINLSHR